MANLKIGLVGSGRWGKLVLRDLIKLNCQVTVVARSEESKKNALDAGAVSIVNSIAELKVIDGAVVCSSTITHYQVITELLNKFGNLPIFCEKPVTASLADALDLEKRAVDNLFVMDKWRYHPGILELKKIVSSEKLGKVIGIKTLRTAWGCPHTDVDPIWILLPHDLAIILEIIGYIPQVTKAVAEYFDNKVFGITAILGDKPWAITTVGSRSLDYKREVKLFFEHGVAELNDAYADELLIARSDRNFINGKPEIEKQILSKEMPLLEELSAFVKFIKGGTAPKSSISEGRLIVERISQIRELAGIG